MYTKHTPLTMIRTTRLTLPIAVVSALIFSVGIAGSERHALTGQTQQWVWEQEGHSDDGVFDWEFGWQEGWEEPVSENMLEGEDVPEEETMREDIEALLQETPAVEAEHGGPFIDSPASWMPVPAEATPGGPVADRRGIPLVDGCQAGEFCSDGLSFDHCPDSANIGTVRFCGAGMCYACPSLPQADPIEEATGDALRDTTASARQGTASRVGSVEARASSVGSGTESLEQSVQSSQCRSTISRPAECFAAGGGLRCPICGNSSCPCVCDCQTQRPVEPGQDLSKCGNAQIDSSGEYCDDGNRTPGDGCTATCKHEPGYSCATNVGDMQCVSKAVPVCGNGRLEINEECDDGDGDGLAVSMGGITVVCGSDCTHAPPVCANGIARNILGTGQAPFVTRDGDVVFHSWGIATDPSYLSHDAANFITYDRETDRSAATVLKAHPLLGPVHGSFTLMDASGRFLVARVQYSVSDGASSLNNVLYDRETNIYHTLGLGDPLGVSGRGDVLLQKAKTLTIVNPILHEDAVIARQGTDPAFQYFDWGKYRTTVFERQTGAISDDGGTVAFNGTQQDGARGIYVFDRETASVQRIAEVADASELFLSRDGGWVAYSQAGNAHRIRTSGDTPAETLPVGSAVTGIRGMSDDGSVFLLNTGGDRYLHYVVGQAPTPVKGESQYRMIGLSADGTWVATVDGFYSVRLERPGSDEDFHLPTEYTCPNEAARSQVTALDLRDPKPVEVQQSSSQSSQERSSQASSASSQGLSPRYAQSIQCTVFPTPIVENGPPAAECGQAPQACPAYQKAQAMGFAFKTTDDRPQIGIVDQNGSRLLYIEKDGATYPLRASGIDFPLTTRNGRFAFGSSVSLGQVGLFDTQDGRFYPMPAKTKHACFAFNAGKSPLIHSDETGKYVAISSPGEREGNGSDETRNGVITLIDASNPDDPVATKLLQGYRAIVSPDGAYVSYFKGTSSSEHLYLTSFATGKEHDLGEAQSYQPVLFNGRGHYVVFTGTYNPITGNNQLMFDTRTKRDTDINPWKYFAISTDGSQFLTREPEYDPITGKPSGYTYWIATKQTPWALAKFHSFAETEQAGFKPLNKNWEYLDFSVYSPLQDWKYLDFSTATSLAKQRKFYETVQDCPSVPFCASFTDAHRLSIAPGGGVASSTRR